MVSTHEPLLDKNREELYWEQVRQLLVLPEHVEQGYSHVVHTPPKLPFCKGIVPFGQVNEQVKFIELRKLPLEHCEQLLLDPRQILQAASQLSQLVDKLLAYVEFGQSYAGRHE